MPSQALLASLRAKVEVIEQRPMDCYNKDFLCTWDHTLESLVNLVGVADLLQQMVHGGLCTRVFTSGLAISNFCSPCDPARLALASAASLLGLHHEEARRENTPVAPQAQAATLAFLTEAIAMRDVYSGQGHAAAQALAQALEESFQEGILPQRPTLLNLQNELAHPTQALGDLLHLQEAFGSLRALRGKKIALSWVHASTGPRAASLPQSLLGLLPRFGMKVVLAHPEGYNLDPTVIEKATRFATQHRGSFSHTHNIEEAFQDADLVYPTYWSPQALMQQIHTRWRAQEPHHDTTTREKDDALEQEIRTHDARYADWRCTTALMQHTHEEDALYLHHLPAALSENNTGEVSADLLPRVRLSTIHQASHKLYIIAAMILLSRTPNPTTSLHTLLDQATPRRI